MSDNLREQMVETLCAVWPNHRHHCSRLADALLGDGPVGRRLEAGEAAERELLRTWRERDELSAERDRLAEENEKLREGWEHGEATAQSTIDAYDEMLDRLVEVGRGLVFDSACERCQRVRVELTAALSALPDEVKP